MTANAQAPIDVRLLDAAAAEDAAQVEALAELINRAYAEAAGLWRDRAARTTAHEVAALVRAGEIALATVRGRLAGSVRIHDVAPGVAQFGMLAAAPEDRGTGVGRAAAASRRSTRSSRRCSPPRATSSSTPSRSHRRRPAAALELPCIGRPRAASVLRPRDERRPADEGSR